jgi:hypothetical protein
MSNRYDLWEAGGRKGEQEEKREKKEQGKEEGDGMKGGREREGGCDKANRAFTGLLAGHSILLRLALNTRAIFNREILAALLEGKF